MKPLSTQGKADRFRNAIAAQTWYAACEDGHPFWSGNDESTYAAAQSDATAHDASVHNDGKAHAVVLPGS
jgi:hypothetical protein